MLCIGHRGAAGHEPENTLRSVRRALEMGVDGVEIDVYHVHGRLVVIHDSTLERTTNGVGRISRIPLEKLRALDAGKGERIPFLEEVIEVIGRRVFLNIELKGVGTGGPVLEVLNGYLGRGWAHADFLVSSFRKRELEVFVGSGFPAGILRNSARLLGPLPYANVHLPLRRVTAKVVRRVHEAGKRVFAFTVNERVEMERMAGMGVDGIFTDFPDKWIGK